MWTGGLFLFSHIMKLKRGHAHCPPCFSRDHHVFKSRLRLWLSKVASELGVQCFLWRIWSTPAVNVNNLLLIATNIELCNYFWSSSHSDWNLLEFVRECVRTFKVVSNLKWNWTKCCTCAKKGQQRPFGWLGIYSGAIFFAIRKIEVDEKFSKREFI